jgi:hypothetical protein
MSTPDPVPVGDIDAQLSKAVKGVHRARWWTLGIVGGAMLVALAVLGILVYHQQRELEASCSFYYSASVVPVTPAAPATQPSLLGVKLIASARVSYYGQDCGGKLPQNPSLKHWASYYHVRYVP